MATRTRHLDFLPALPLVRGTAWRSVTWLLLLSGALLAHAETYVPPTTHRVALDLDAGWRFIRQDVSGAQTNGFDDSTWTALDLPHTWNNLDGQDGGNNYYRGPGWYRRHCTVDASYARRELFLKFDGANIVSDVWVNGSYVGQHRGGFAAFVFDVTTNLIVGGDNVIAVKVNNAVNTNVPPLSADFTFYGGLYRDVHLLVTDPLHVSPLDYGSPGVYLKTTNVSASSAALQVTTVVSNASTLARTVMVRAVVTDAATNIVRTLTNVLTLPPASSSNVSASATITSPHLWDGLADPYLYRVFVEVGDGTNVTDLVSQPLGFRWFRFDAANGFFLNGRYYDLHGVNMHQDWLGRGWAIGDAERRTNFALLKEIGATVVRLAHYQHAEYTYQLADENGIVVWAEIPLVNGVSISTEFNANTQQQLRELIRQNFNHPAIVCWSLYNEEGIAATNIVSQLAPLAEQEDPTRPSTAGSNQGDSSALNWIPDIVAFNKYYGWYSCCTNNFGSWADTIHANYPTRCIGVSEYGAGASVWQHSESPSQPANTATGFHPEEWQNLVHESIWMQMKARPFLWGKFVWNMFDFGVDSRNEGDTPGRNDKGLVTYDRQIRKDAFFWYKANWTTNPMVYITGHTFTNRKASVITARIYANCDTVELWFNGVSLGAKASPNRIFTWPLALAAGTNSVLAIGTSSGTTVADALVWTLQAEPYWGTPASIPGRIQAEDFDTGIEGIAYHDTDSTNTGGQYRTSDAVDIEACTDTGGGFDVTSIAAGEWLGYAVNVVSSGYYDVQLRVASASSARTLRLALDGADLAGAIALPNTGGAQVWQTLTVSNVLIQAGVHALRVTSDTGGFNLNWLAFSYRPAPGDFSVKINFVVTNSASFTGWQKDVGFTYANRGNGYSYGWNQDVTTQARERNSTNSADKRYDTLIHMQKTTSNAVWEIAVPNGTYTVCAASGDPGYTDSTHGLTAESATLLSGAPSTSRFWIEGATQVAVTDGRLSVAPGSSAVNTKINFLEIAATAPLLSVRSSSASANEFGPGTNIVLTITRDLNTNADLTVSYRLSGTASNGLDYVALPGNVTIPAGSASAEVWLKVLPDNLAEGDETAVFTLQPSPSYVVSTNAAVMMIIHDAPIDAWRLTHFGTNANNVAIAGDAADPDHDGLINLLEYACGTDPRASNGVAPWSIAIEAGHLSLTYPRRTPPTDVTSTVDAANQPAGSWSNTVSEQILDGDGLMQSVRATDSQSVTQAPQRFLRLKTTRP